ncbi:MAG: hypothetical protein GXP61_11415 [Epsilonproteobacteria bacterium]|nr:hypothetical protein [Campylobacterota bacterium]
MKSKIEIFLILSILLGFSGCMGPNTYAIFKEHRDFEIGFSIKNKKYILNTKEKTIYDKNHYLYIVKHPKHCIWGYIVRKKYKKQIIVDWVIISGKKYCKEEETLSWADII